MSKKLRILVPQTIDGRNLAYDDEKKPIYTESIVEIGSKKDFESLNAKLPDHLKYKFEEIEVDGATSVLEDTEVAPSTTFADFAKKVIESKDAVIESKDAVIEELQKKLEAVQSNTVAPVLTPVVAPDLAPVTTEADKTTKK